MSRQPVSEVKIVVSLALLYVFRMLGLFMVLPVLMLYGNDYSGATPLLLGLALGIYGFTQACFQIPLGLLSDFWGRKPVIVLGLLVFAAGSVVAANADSITGLVLGRALQGAGAIASAVMALVTDLTSEQNRTKAMAAIGASIGVSFALALILGPVMAGFGGMAAVFWLSAGLAAAGLWVVWRLVPTPPTSARPERRDTRAVPELIRSTLAHSELLRLDGGIFSLHFILMASFVAVPGLLESFAVDASDHWKIYLPVMLLSFVAMLPFVVLAERKRRIKPVFIGAVAVLALAQLGLMQWHDRWLTTLAMLFVFFVAFNLLEATLPSLISKWAPAGGKGTAMGIYSTSQFLGAFGGGVAGGLALEISGPVGVFSICTLVALLWWLAAFFMRPPRHLASLKLNIDGSPQMAVRALDVAGVDEAAWVAEEGLLYLKVDEAEFDREQLLLLASTPEPASGAR